MNLNDFRYQRRGVIYNPISAEDSKLLQEFRYHSKKHDRAILLIHGFSSAPAVFRYFFEPLQQYDCIVAPVLPGHGDSVDAFAAATAQDWLEHVAARCETLIQQYKQVDIMGLSLGGLLACQLANRFPLHHLYLLAPALNLQFAPLGTANVLKLARFCKALGFSRVKNCAGTIRKNDQFEIAYQQSSIPAIIEILNLVEQFDFIPPQCPTDVFLGQFDTVVDSKKVAARFAGLENVTIHWLKQSAHILTIDNDYEAIIQCVLNQQDD